MFGLTDITVIFGQRGSGKSTLGRKIASAYPRLIVIDRLMEWENPDAIYCNTFDAFAGAIKSVINSDTFIIVLQFDVEAKTEAQAETFNHALRLAYKGGQISNKNICVLIEEVHFFASPSLIEKWLFECVMTGRHAGLAIIASSQRPASVHKGLVSQAAHVIIGQLFERRDLEYLDQCIGETAWQASTLKKFSFLHYRPGQKTVLIPGPENKKGKHNASPSDNKTKSGVKVLLPEPIEKTPEELPTDVNNNPDSQSLDS